ncbi:MAG: peptide ABC transporter substrate-binding protein [Gemmatimonadetes bacterium]|nr:peptide ABC transporter substrate-binding protein [Gemmatimonadota bacterium]
MRRRTVLHLLLLLGALGRAPLPAQVPGTVVFAIGEDPTLPLPAITDRTADTDLADQLFLRLAILGPTFRTAGDRAMTPMLARQWQRIDPRTLVFELDPRARWQDGTPVTARDVVFTWQLMMDPVVGKGRIMMEPVASVDAMGTGKVRVRFKRPFAEQLYLFAFNMQPLPAHLLEGIAPTAIARSDFAAGPIGNGPYRYLRRVPGQFVELRADPTFFLGAPTIARVVLRIAPDATARTNLLLAGETDVMGDVQAPDVPKIRAVPSLALLNISHNLLLWVGINQRRPGTDAPHPMLADRRVREALRLALDRRTMATGVFGPGTGVPDAAQSQLWAWVTAGGLVGTPQNVARARALLTEAGWRDTNGDGIVERNGMPLRLQLIYPNTSGARHSLALQAQAMWRAVGIEVVLDRIERTAFTERMLAGRFDLTIDAANQDVTPSSLTQRWSCAAAREPTSLNTIRWCDPTFDRLLANAETSPDPVASYRAAFARMAIEVPAIILAAPLNQVAVHTRYANVQLWPAKSWLSLWQWRVRPDAALPRDR